MIDRRGMLLLHDSIRLHVAKQAVKKLAEYKYEILPHSHDHSPIDLFKYFDRFLREKIFQAESDVKSALCFNEFLASRSSNFYVKGIDVLSACITLEEVQTNQSE